MQLRCNRCHRPMRGTTAYDGACSCGGLIERTPDVVTSDARKICRAFDAADELDSTEIGI